jgi:hypothetical protein
MGKVLQLRKAILSRVRQSILRPRPVKPASLIRKGWAGLAFEKINKNKIKQLEDYRPANLTYLGKYERIDIRTVRKQHPTTRR